MDPRNDFPYTHRQYMSICRGGDVKYTPARRDAVNHGVPSVLLRLAQELFDLAVEEADD